MNSLYTDLQWLPRVSQEFSARLKALENSAGPLGCELQALALQALDLNQLTKLARFIAKAQSEGRNLNPLTPFRLAMLSNSTIDLIVPALVASAVRPHPVLRRVRARSVCRPAERVGTARHRPANGTDCSRLFQGPRARDALQHGACRRIVAVDPTGTANPQAIRRLPTGSRVPVLCLLELLRIHRHCDRTGAVDARAPARELQSALFGYLVSGFLEQVAHYTLNLDEDICIQPAAGGSDAAHLVLDAATASWRFLLLHYVLPRWRLAWAQFGVHFFRRAVGCRGIDQ